MNTIYLTIIKWLTNLLPAKQIVALLLVLCFIGGGVAYFLFNRTDSRDALCDKEKERLRIEIVALRKEKDSVILSMIMLNDAKVNEQALKVNEELKEQITKITRLNDERDRLRETNQRVININKKTLEKLKNVQK